MSVLKHVVSMRIKKLKIAHPDWTLVQVMAFIMSDVNQQLTTSMVKELVEHVILEMGKG